MKNPFKKRNRKLIYSMSMMVVFCWLIPLLIFMAVMVMMVTRRLNSQIENTIVTTSDKAMEICLLQLDDVSTASKNASYSTVIEDAYKKYRLNNSRSELYNSVKSYLDTNYKNNPSIKDVFLVFLDDPDNIYYTYSNSHPLTRLDVSDFSGKYEEDVLKQASEYGTGAHLILSSNRVFMIRNMLDQNFETYGVLVFELDEDVLFESLNSIWGAIGYRVYIDDSPIIFDGSLGNSEIRNFPAIYGNACYENAVYFKNNDNYYVYKNIKLDNEKISLLVKLAKNAIFDEMSVVRTLEFSMVAVMIVLFGMLFIFLRSNVTRPVRTIEAGAREITQGNYGHQISGTGGGLEFASLENSFNAMSAELKHQFETIYLEELELKDAQIMALQSQINPHFLNNTLEIINWESRMNGNIKVSSMIEALSVMLNATMNRRKQRMIALSEELSYVDAYLHIIKQRFGTRLQIKQEIDHSLLSVEVPKLIIQPIIENAVEHGMDKRNQGVVELKVYRVDKKLYIDVINNGKMSDEDRERIDYLLGEEVDEDKERSVSLGIRNVNRRIKIIYGEEYGLSIYSNEEGNTVSSIVLSTDFTEEPRYEKETDIDN